MARLPSPRLPKWEVPQRSYTADDILLIPGGENLVASRSHVKLDPLIYSAPMDRVTGYDMAKALIELGEMPVVSRFIHDHELVAVLEELAGEPNCFIAVPGEPQKLAEAIDKIHTHLPSGANVNVAIDIAHGASVYGLDAVSRLRSLPRINDIMTGSIASPSLVYELLKAGATHLRVGIGNGSMCTTRLMTGCGMPQFTAVQWISNHVSDLLRGYHVSNNPVIIADGGIRSPGDAVKYLVAGADAFMLGSAFSRTFESPGWREEVIPTDFSKPVVFPVVQGSKLVKSYRGQASASFQQDTYGQASTCPEGVSTSEFEWEGIVASDIVGQYRKGIQTACSYLGLRHSKNLNQKNVHYTVVTSNTVGMNKPHGL